MIRGGTVEQDEEDEGGGGGWSGIIEGPARSILNYKRREE